MLHFRAHRLLKSLLVAVLCCAASVGYADDLQQIFMLAAENDLLIRQARATYNANHTLLDQGRARLLPIVNLNGSSSRDTAGVDGVASVNPLFRTPTHRFADGFNAKGYGVNLQQNLLNFETWYSYKAVQKGDAMAQLQLAQAEQALIMRVATAYVAALRSQANLESFQAEVLASQQILAQTQRRYDAGLIPQIDLYDSKANADLASVNLLVAKNNLAQRLKALEVITGQSHTTLATLQESFPVTTVDVPLQDWIAAALANNPTVKAAAVDLDAKNYAANAARAAMLPVVDLNVGYNWNQSGNPFSFSQLPQERSNITLTMSLPVFAGGANRARMRQAYYQRDATEAAMLKSRRDSSETINNSYNNVETDVLAVAARAQALASAQSALNATQVGADAGTRNLVDVVLAQRTLYAAQREHSNAIFDYVVDSLALKQTAGTLNPQDILDLNQWLGP
jgi:outer membrane protein